MNNGFIKLDRDITKTLVWYDPFLLRLMVWCLYKARFASGTVIYNGLEIELETNQFVTGRFNIEKEFNANLSKEFRRTGQSLTRALDKLEKMNFIEQQKTSKYTLVTILSDDDTAHDEHHHEQQIDITVHNTMHTKEESNKKVIESNKNNTYIVELIDHLNLKTGSKYRASTKSTIKLVNSALKIYELSDLKQIVDNMALSWLGTEWEQYLKPDTLFRESNLEKYLNWKQKDTVGKEKSNAEYLPTIERI